MKIWLSVFGQCLLAIPLFAQSGPDYPALVDLDDFLNLERNRAEIIEAQQVSKIELEEPKIYPQPIDPFNSVISRLPTFPNDLSQSIALFSWSPLGYRTRGYEDDQQEIYINGLLMNDMEYGAPPRSNHSGLHYLFRNPVTIRGWEPLYEGFGGLNGAILLHLNAARQVQQTKLFYTHSNHSFRHRFLMTHHTGMMDNGWAISLAASAGGGKEGYVPGTYYHSYAGYVAVSKKTGKYGIVQLTTFAAPSEQGGTLLSTPEAASLAETHYYNPAWGYQDGKKRNASVTTHQQPLILLHYRSQPTSSFLWQLTAGYEWGYSGYSSLDWYNAQDPRPDYYRNLPSYYLNLPGGPDLPSAETLQTEWRNNPEKAQINWKELYEANGINEETLMGYIGLRSLYVMGTDRKDKRKYNLAFYLHKKWQERISFQSGIQLQRQNTLNYRKLTDLLGGDYYVNYNQFTERTYSGNTDFMQNDLNNPDRIIRKDDHYAYRYIARFLQTSAWAQALFTFPKLNFFLAGRAGRITYYREGLYKTGLFADDSYGKSNTQQFFPYNIKGGLTYKLNNNHYLYLHADYLTQAPLFNHTFVAPRSRNTVIKDPGLEHIRSIEGTYELRTPFIQGRLSGYATARQHKTQIMRFYHEDYRSFVNYAVRGIDSRHLGIESALAFRLSSKWRTIIAGTWMQAFYTSRPEVTIYRDNDTSGTTTATTVYWENYYATTGPQSAYTLSLSYQYMPSGYINLQMNYLDRNFVAINPSRRTSEAVDMLEAGSPSWHAIMDQQQLPSIFTLDLFARKSFKIRPYLKRSAKNTIAQVNLAVNNLLNNRNVITAGFEQLRFDFSNRNPESFPTKYRYGYGITYTIQMNLTF